MKTTVLYSDFGFELTRNERDDFYLSVLVETTPPRRIIIQLTTVELNLYLEVGEFFVRKLALDVCREPERFIHRDLTRR